MTATTPLRVATALSLAALALCGAPPARADYSGGIAALRAGGYAKAMEEWRKPAEGGDARAQYGIGYLYQFGLGVAPDNGQAKAWYEKAAAQGNADALFALGSMYESGKAGRQDLAEALKDYHAAAVAGSADAEFAIGRMMMRGRGAARDEKGGVAWLRKAAEHGQPAAQYLLGAACETGEGVAADPVEAYYWYSLALGGDPVALRQADPAFDPKVALAALRRRMSAGEIARAEARLKARAGDSQGRPANQASPPAASRN